MITEQGNSLEIIPVFHPPGSEFQAGEIHKEKNVGGCAVSSFFVGGKQLSTKQVRNNLAGIPIPFFNKRLDHVMEEADKKIQFQAEAVYGYRTAAEEADAVCL